MTRHTKELPETHIDERTVVRRMTTTSTGERDGTQGERRCAEEWLERGELFIGDGFFYR